MVIRYGKPAATIGPAEKGTSMRTLKELAIVLKTMPKLDDDDKFAADVEEIITKKFGPVGTPNIIPIVTDLLLCGKTGNR